MVVAVEAAACPGLKLCMVASRWRCEVEEACMESRAFCSRRAPSYENLILFPCACTHTAPKRHTPLFSPVGILQCTKIRSTTLLQMPNPGLPFGLMHGPFWRLCVCVLCAASTGLLLPSQPGLKHTSVEGEWREPLKVHNTHRRRALQAIIPKVHVPKSRRRMEETPTGRTKERTNEGRKQEATTVGRIAPRCRREM